MTASTVLSEEAFQGHRFSICLASRQSGNANSDAPHYEEMLEMT
jgi:hypothetical protein